MVRVCSFCSLFFTRTELPCCNKQLPPSLLRANNKVPIYLSLQGTNNIFVIRTARRSNFSKMIAESYNNARKLFTTMNRFLNPAPVNDVLDQRSSTRCEEFPIFFNNKITSIRAAIVINANNYINWYSKNIANISKFTTMSDQELYKLVNESKSSMCRLFSHMS